MDYSTQLGNELLTKLTSITHRDGRRVHEQFMELPSKVLYPDYYTFIHVPISFAEIREKLNSGHYFTADDVVNDFKQVFINAKNYNARGSLIFEDAKVLHKLLKHICEGHGTWDLPQDDPEYVPLNLAHTTTIAVDLARLNGNKRGVTIKQWLGAKLEQLMSIKEPTSNMAYSETFRVLPDKYEWPDYYKFIVNPISLDNVASKIHKRQYTTVQQFIDDVMLVFTNAEFYNEESSLIAQYARLLKTQFLEIMKETPPEFAPPRKYNTKRRQAEEAARLANEAYAPSPEATNDDNYSDGDPDYESPASTMTPAALPTAEKSASPSIYGGTSLPENPAPAAVKAPNLVPDHSALRAKISTPEDVSSIQHFVVQTVPSGMSIILQNETVRQHSIFVPSNVHTVNISPALNHSKPRATGYQVTARPASASIQQYGHGAEPKYFSVNLINPFTVLEIVVNDTVKPEVYRIFVQK